MKYSPLIISMSFCTLLIAGCAGIEIDNPVDDVIADLKYINPVPRLKSWNTRQTLDWYDENKDGALNRDEFDAGMSESSKYRLKAAQSDLTVERYLAADFSRADANNDGRLSFTEFHVGRTAEGIAIPDQPPHSALRQSLTRGR